MKHFFGDKDFLKKLIAIALPIGLQAVVNMLVNLIDTIMVGKLGDIALSSVNLSSQFPYLSITTVMGVGNAGLVLASQAWGNNKPEKVKAVLSFCLKLSAIFGFAFFLLSFLFPKEIIAIYTNDPEIIATGQKYLKILSYSMLFQAFSQVIVIILRAAGVNKLGFYSSTLACILNVFFNWVFIFGNLGAPALGVMGAAIGTVISRIIESLIIIIYMLNEDNLHFRLPDLRMTLESDMRKDYVKVARPSIISEVTQNLNVSAAAMITGRVSSYYIAANSIVHNIWTLSSLFLFGIAMGASVMVGHEIGAKRNDQAKQYAHYFIRIGFLIGIFGAMMIQVIAPTIMSFFNVSKEALETAKILTKAASIVIVFLALQLILTKGILRGGGQAEAVTRVDLITCWLINLPVGYFVALVLHANPFWIYLSLRIDYLIKTIWGLWRVKRGDWIIRMNVD